MRYFKPSDVGALNTLKGKGLLVRMRTEITLKDLKKVQAESRSFSILDVEAFVLSC